MVLLSLMPANGFNSCRHAATHRLNISYELCFALAVNVNTINSLFDLQLSTLGLVWPSLLLTYLGQAAFLTKHPEAYGAAYFTSVPHPVFWPMFIIAVLAAIIASQVCHVCLLSGFLHPRYTSKCVICQQCLFSMLSFLRLCFWL